MPALPHLRPRHEINHEPTPDQDLIDGLEPDQLVSATAKPLARMALTLRDDIGLWALRIFVLVMSGLVVYTFIRALP